MLHHTTTLHLPVIFLSLVTFSHNVSNFKCDFAKNISEDTSTSQTLTFRHFLQLKEVNNVRQIFPPFLERGICGVAVLMFFQCGVAVISNPTVCDVYVFHAAVYGEMKLFAVLGFLD